MTYIHRIWMGSEMPDNFKRYGEEWKELNPDMKVIDWDDSTLFMNEVINGEVISDMLKRGRQDGADKVAMWTHMADVLDYELLYEYGGWYFNTDMKPLKPLSGLSVTGPALAMEDDIHPVNMAMYSPPRDPFFAKVIELLPKRYFSMPGAYMNATTGVQLLEQAIQEYDGPLSVFHRNVFNPVHWSEFDYGEEPDIDREFPEETVAVHLWGHRTNQRGQRILEN